MSVAQRRAADDGSFRGRESDPDSEQKSVPTRTVGSTLP